MVSCSARLWTRFPLVACVAVACDRPADAGLPGGVDFVERDSAGVLVATTSGARARAQIGWVVDAAPEYQVGELAGEEPYIFTSIGGTRQLADGRVAVLDKRSCELRFFGPDGVFVELTGGLGEGPGEFGWRCALLPLSGSDSLVVSDGARLSFFDQRGRFAHRLRVLWPGKYVTHVIGVSGERVLVEERTLITSRSEGLAREPSTAKFALLEVGSGRVAWESSLQAKESYTVMVTGSPAGRGIWPLPFDILPEAALGTNGHYLMRGENHAPDILEFDTSGRLRRIVRLAEAEVVPTAETLDKYVEFRLHLLDIPDPDVDRKRVLDGLRWRYEQMPLPDIMPVFSRLLLDDMGWLWAELYRFDVQQPFRWLVFGPNGEGLGSVDMPPDLQVRQIGQDFVLGVWRDDNDVEYVRRHVITGRNAFGPPRRAAPRRRFPRRRAGQRNPSAGRPARARPALPCPLPCSR